MRPCLLGIGDFGHQAAGRKPEAFADRPFHELFAYLVPDARHEKAREAGVVMSQAVLIAVGVDWDGRRQILAVNMPREPPAWKDFLVALKGRVAATMPYAVSHYFRAIIESDSAGHRTSDVHLICELSEN